MKIIALDSSGLVASIAILDETNLLAEYTLNYKKTHSQTLMPMLEEIRNILELDLNTIDAIAIASGPGSFTGLRIGAATAKGLGMALEKPLIEVPTLAGLAYNLSGTKALICPIMDARRNQVYTGIYRSKYKEEYVLEEVMQQAPMDILELIQYCNNLGEEIIFLGDGVEVYRDTIFAACQVPFSFAPASMNKQRAASIACLGRIYGKEGNLIPAREHQPDYLRLSQAEREREELRGKNSETK